VVITRSLTLQGADKSTTIINGGRAGVVISVTNNAAVTIDGFTITGGDGSNNVYLSGSSPDSGGGGIFIREATAIIRNNVIADNVGSQITTTSGLGGGILVISSTNAVHIYNNTIQANVAQSVTLAASVPISAGVGGGILIGDASSAIITGNQVLSNVALRANISPQDAWGGGGGIIWWGDNITIDGNTIQGNTGNEAGGNGSGGGIGLWGGVATITNNSIVQNTAAISGTSGDGGGIQAGDLQALTLTGNWVMSNMAILTVTGANPDAYAGGGGVYIDGYGTANDTFTMQDNHIIGNVAAQRMSTSGTAWGHAEGGGLLVRNITTTLVVSNEVRWNVAVITSSLSGSHPGEDWGGRPAGGGMYLAENDSVTLSDNDIRDNVTAQQQAVNDVDAGSEGGGIALINVGTVTVSTNTIASNAAVITGSITSNAGRGFFANGGGIMIGCWDRPDCDLSLVGNDILDNVTAYSITVSGSNANSGAGGGGIDLGQSTALLQSNVISGNTGNLAGDGWGGGVNSSESRVTMEGNLILGNRMNSSYSGGNGGVWVWESTLTSTNDIFARNYSAIGAGDDGTASTLILINDTLYDNGDTGVSVGNSSTAYITNTIVYSHNGGLDNYNSPTATLIGNYNLLSNTTNYVGGVVAGTNDITGTDPLLVDAAMDDFHLTSSSLAIDKGTSSGAPSKDFEGDQRPQDSGIDIGADEFTLEKIYLPTILENASL
jgi:hypothetical protein